MPSIHRDDSGMCHESGGDDFVTVKESSGKNSRSPMKRGSYLNKVLAFLVSTGMLLTFVAPAGATTTGTSTTMVNGGFESNTSTGSNFFDQSLVSGWSTTESDGQIELWNTAFSPGTASARAANVGGTAYRYTAAGPLAGDTSNKTFAEINANGDGMLYQSLETTSGALYTWSVLHRGRLSQTAADVADVLVGPTGSISTAPLASLTANPPTPTASTVQVEMHDAAGTLLDPTAASGTPSTQWGSYAGYYSATAAQTIFGLMVVSSNGGDRTIGNFVDNATWAEIAEPNIQTITSGNADPGAPAMVQNLAPGYVAVPDYSSVPLDPDGRQAPGNYTVPVKIEKLDASGTPQPLTPTMDQVAGTTTPSVDLQTSVPDTIDSTLIIQPLVTTQYQLADGTPIGASTTVPMACAAGSYAGSYTDPSYTAGQTVTIGGVDYMFVAMKSDSDPTSATGATANATVTYVLQPVAAPTPHAVTTTFVDENGNTIAPSTTGSPLNNGDSYSTTPPSTVVGSDGVTYVLDTVKTPSNASGTMGDSDITVTYVYKPAPATVTTNFVDENGKPIKAPTTKGSTSGSDYSTTAPKVITTSTGKKYILQGPSKTSDPVSGTLKKTSVNVTYTYVPANTVTVKFLDQNGKPLSSKDYDFTQATGSSYSVTNPGTVTINGVKYRFVLQAGSDATSGTLNADKTLTYKLVPITSPVTPIASLPKTGDVVSFDLPILLLAAGAAVVLSRRRRQAGEAQG
ncbi:MAG: MucBP domain-containing protein [Coriobacteriia bacterium]|nr:MucBP domain-containing protein [Coriobacteriia bacterium]